MSRYTVLWTRNVPRANPEPLQSGRNSVQGLNGLLYQQLGHAILGQHSDLISRLLVDFVGLDTVEIVAMPVRSS